MANRNSIVAQQLSAAQEELRLLQEKYKSVQAELARVENCNQEMSKEVTKLGRQVHYSTTLRDFAETARTRIIEVAERSNDRVIRYALLFIAQDMKPAEVKS